MRLTQPDPTNPNVSHTYTYPDAPFERLMQWLIAVPIGQRGMLAVERKIGDFKLELSELRYSGKATLDTPSASKVFLSEPGAVVVDELVETPKQAAARRMRAAKAKKRLALAGSEA